jgi:hypothetical protein
MPPRKPSNKAPAAAGFARLKAKWYAKLKRSGFKDIECGRDLNKSAGQTFRGAGPNSHVLWEFTDDNFGPAGSGYDETRGIPDLDKFEYFDRIGHYAQSLPDMTRRQQRRKLACIAASQGKSRTQTAKELNMSLTYVNSIWDAMLQELNLPGSKDRARMAHEPPAEPAPVRILSKQEIAKLDCTPPKDIPSESQSLHGLMPFESHPGSKMRNGARPFPKKPGSR